MYQIYYYETVGEHYIGKRVDYFDAVFYTEAETERYCNSHAGWQKVGDEWIENELRWEEVDEDIWLLHLIRHVLIEFGLIATEELEKEIMFRCSDFEINDTFTTLDLMGNIKACVMFTLINGFQALKDEEDDGVIWEYQY